MRFYNRTWVNMPSVLTTKKKDYTLSHLRRTDKELAFK